MQGLVAVICRTRLRHTQFFHGLPVAGRFKEITMTETEEPGIPWWQKAYCVAFWRDARVFSVRDCLSVSIPNSPSRDSAQRDVHHRLFVWTHSLQLFVSHHAHALEKKTAAVKLSPISSHHVLERTFWLILLTGPQREMLSAVHEVHPDGYKQKYRAVSRT